MPPKLKKLLICDDDKDIRFLIAKMGCGRYEIFEAADGTEALRLAGEQFFDVALLDLDLPGFDGLEALQRLLRLLPQLRVTMLTGNTDIETARRALDLGAHAYITKPITCGPSEFWGLVDPDVRTDVEKPWRVVDAPPRD